jgi:hypothetical protein
MYIPLDILDIILRKRKMMMFITKLEKILKFPTTQLFFRQCIPPDPIYS